jgi:hypothetical protein
MTQAGLSGEIAFGFFYGGLEGLGWVTACDSPAHEGVELVP